MSRELQDRTKKFSLSIIKLVEEQVYTITQKIVINQLLKSATSVGANFRSACRSRSDREFVAKLNIVLEEADESCYWLEIIKEMNWSPVESHLKEANELTAIFVTMLKKMNQKISNPNLHPTP